MASAAPVWIVATDQTASAWAEVVAASGREVELLAWGAATPQSSVGELEAAVARLRPSLLLLTSPEALLFLRGAQPPQVPAACVGPRTAEAAHAAGVPVALVGAAGAGDLVARLLALRPLPERLLWLRGREAREEAVDRLRSSRVGIEELVTYDVAPTADFGARLAQVADPVAVVVGSPRGAVALLEGLRGRTRGVPQAAIFVAAGATTGERLRQLGVNNVRCADPPGVASILSLLP